MNYDFNLGKVDLNVRDLPLMSHFYTKVIGLTVVNQTTTTTSLGRAGKILVKLHQAKLLPAPATSAGLYHVALLYRQRQDLAKTIAQVLKVSPESFTGSADHLVSEAFYFNDPEGNGIELYFDRERSAWVWDQNQIRMATIYLDPAQYIEKYLLSNETELETQVGHVHLKVGDIQDAHDFYVKFLGFDVTLQMPSALFISVGGYHHHLGLNTWESQGAGKRIESLGLKSLEFVLTDLKQFKYLKEKLVQEKIEFNEEDASLIFHDPWGNQIRVRLQPQESLEDHETRR